MINLMEQNMAKFVSMSSQRWPHQFMVEGKQYIAVLPATLKVFGEYNLVKEIKHPKKSSATIGYLSTRFQLGNEPVN